eukprot:10070990-Ditylum_brightwellii.AAC.1
MQKFCPSSVHGGGKLASLALLMIGFIANLLGRRVQKSPFHIVLCNGNNCPVAGVAGTYVVGCVHVGCKYGVLGTKMEHREDGSGMWGRGFVRTWCPRSLKFGCGWITTMSV